MNSNRIKPNSNKSCDRKHFEDDHDISCSHSNEVAQLASEYIQHGFQPLPIVRLGDGSDNDGKNPGYSRWLNYRCTADEIVQAFDLDQLKRSCPRTWHKAVSVNVGLLLGLLSGGLIDIDIDDLIAITIADYLLPGTEMIHGRLSKPHSHHWYICFETIRTTKYIDPEDNSMLVELRSTGGQTVVPPSIHPSGERLTWEGELKPAVISRSEIVTAVEQVAAASLIARRWKPGIRDLLTMHLAGAFAHSGIDEDLACKLLRAICAAAHDEETDSRIRVLHDTYAKHRAGIPVTGLPKVNELLGEKVMNKIQQWLHLPHNQALGSPEAPKSDGRKGRVAPADILLGIAEEGIIRHFVDQTGRAYVQLQSDDSMRYCEVDSLEFKDFLRLQYRARTHTLIDSSPLRTVIEELSASARVAGATETIFNRIGHRDGKIYHDLANSKHEAIEIDSDGWRCIQNPPVVFRHSNNKLPLPQPVRGGSINELRELLNVTDEQWCLLAAYCFTCFFPVGSFPVLVLTGEQNTAKSTTARVLKRLIDPTRADLRMQPDTIETVMLAAQEDVLLAFDNLSKIPDWFSDTLCSLSTGGTFSTRKFYSNSEECRFSAKQPVILTGINDLVRNSDLKDRIIQIILLPIQEHRKKGETEFMNEFMAALPRVLGAMFDVVVQIKRNLSGVLLGQKPRMTDFAECGVASEGSSGLLAGSFLQAYRHNQLSTSMAAVENNPLLQCVMEWGRALKTPWEGRANQLLAVLRANLGEHPLPGWLPKDARAMGNALRANAPSMRQAGLIISFSESHNAALWRIEKPRAVK